MSSLQPPSPWSLLASGWEELFPLRQARLDLALGLAAPGAVCLDAGCATGSLSRALAARGRVAHGLDLDPTFLASARQRALAEGLALTWHESSLLELASAVAGQKFQLITCLGQTLPHLLDDDQSLARFETVFQPLAGPAITSQTTHRRMAPAEAAALLRKAGLRPDPPLADEAANPFQEASAGWVLIARRDPAV